MANNCNCIKRNIFFILVFVFGMIYNLSNNVSDDSWMVYWKYQIYINIVFSFIIIIWFTIGGFVNIKKCFNHLVPVKEITGIQDG